MHADGMTCCSRPIPVATVGLSRLVKNRGKRGGNIHLPPLSYDRNLIASTGGFVIRSLNWERGVLWTVANMSTVGVPYIPKSPSTIPGWRLHSAVNG